jgi:hypothetical protein
MNQSAVAHLLLKITLGCGVTAVFNNMSPSRLMEKPPTGGMPEKVGIAGSIPAR